MNILNNISKKDDSISALIPIEQYDNELNVFKMRSGEKYMDIIQIVSIDLMNKSDHEVEYLNLRWAKFYKTCSADLKLISLNFPTNTRTQQKYIKYKLKNAKNPIYQYFLENKFDELISIEKNRSDREYYLMYFANSEEQLKDVRDIISSSLINYGLAAQMTKDKKIQIIYKFNNPNTALFNVAENSEE
jgi:hypothetical protein|uniref:hypothetical protein n=1 Tax=Eubacterium sp. TaxID=142586 RepID=UPI003FEEE706